MKNCLRALLLLAVLTSVASANIKTVEQNFDAPSFLGYVPDRFIVVMKEQIPEGKRQNGVSAASVGVPSLDAIANLYAVSAIDRQFKGSEKKINARASDIPRHYKVSFSAGDLESAMDAYRKDPNVERVEPIGIHTLYATPNDGFYDPYQWYHNQANDRDIDSPEAWDIEVGQDNTIVAILDSGTRYYHRDLGGALTSPGNPGAARGNMWINTAELNGTGGVDDDANGYTDDWIGYDFIQTTSNCWPGEDCSGQDNDPRDFNGHGTHTAGICGMLTNNGYGMAGVAGGWGNGTEQETGNGVKIMALRMGFSFNFGGQEVGVVYMDAAAEAFYYAADNGANIASCSWGSSNSGGIAAAATYFVNSGGLIFVAAGNDGSQTPGYLNSRSDCISVSGTDSDDTEYSSTTYGTWVDICAPAVGIYSTYHDHLDPNTDYWASLTGTSMACPMAAGVAALIWSQNPTWTASQVESQLYSSADNIDAFLSAPYIGKMGAGRINAYNAVNTGPPPAPVAEFVGTPTSGTEPLTVNFTDQSTGSVTSWSWTFGDGGTSTAQNPSYQYISAGSYTVTLNVTGPGGSDGETKTNYITVNPCVTPTAEFSGTPTSGSEPLTVSFTDQSTGGPTSWSWTFGDGGTSTAQNPTYQYASAGTYTVSLTATNSCGPDGETKVGYITVDPFSGFCDNFNDGDMSDWSEQGGGTWTGVGGQYDGFIGSGYAYSLAPVADMGDGTITVDWTSLAGGTWTNGQIIFGWQDASNYRVVDMRDGANNWYIREFIGGVQNSRANFAENINTSQQYAMEVVVDPGGLVTVRVDGVEKVSYNFGNVVSGAVGLGVQQARSQYDNFCVTSGGVTPPPVAAFSGSPTSGCAPLNVAFSDASTGDITSWAWTFGDGGTSTSQNPSHSYAAPGTYTVALTVTGPGGSDVDTKANYIAVSGAPTAEFSGSPVTGDTPLLVGFTDLSTGGATSWSWTFGDGGTSTAQNPSYTYTAAGSYTVSLTATNACGSDGETKTGYITVSDPPTGGVIGEIAEVTRNQTGAGADWYTVNLNNSYTNPVVVMRGLSTNGGHKTHLRVRNVSGTAFEWQQEEWDYHDGNHTTEDCPYIVLEAGVHTLEDGTLIEAGTASLGTGFAGISFSQSFASTPTLLTGVMSDNDNAAIISRTRALTTSGFEVRIQEEEAADGVHANETVAWVAIGQGVGVNNGATFESARTANAVTNAWYTVNFTANVGANAVFLCHDDTYDGSDPCGTRYRNLGATSVEVFVEEEQSANSEVTHVTEVVSYLVWSAAGDITSSGGMATATSPRDRDMDSPQLVESASTVPQSYVLNQNYPNPFNAGTEITFALQEGGSVSLVVYDVLGRRVRNLISGYHPEGIHTVHFDATDNSGRSLASGMYFYRLSINGFIESKKMMLLK